MAFNIGLNFRATAGYVTDPANTTYCLAADTYPTTRGGATFGWTVGTPDSRDRDSAADPRIAGINFISSGTTNNVRIDLPETGSIDIYLGVTDLGSAYTNGVIRVKDTTTTLVTIGNHAIAATLIYDATDTLRTSSADWAANEAANTQTFSTSICNLNVDITGGVLGTIAHISLAKAGGGPVIPVFMNQYRQRRA